jgi:hypothetical protein
MEHILKNHGLTLLHRNEGAWSSYTEYHTCLSEQGLECADLTDSSAGSRHVPTDTAHGPKKTICTGIPLGESVVYGQNPPNHRKTAWGESTWLSHDIYWKVKYFGSRYPHYRGRRRREVGAWYTKSQSVWRCFSAVWGNKERRMGRWRLIECRSGVYRSRQRNPPYAGRTPTTLAYLHQYDMESAYLFPRGRE